MTMTGEWCLEGSISFMPRLQKLPSKADYLHHIQAQEQEQEQTQTQKRYDGVRAVPGDGSLYLFWVLVLIMGTLKH
jgi:hypothetical protein